MTQISRFARARQLTATVLPGRRPDAHAGLVAARLRKLAAARSTGMLPFSGHGDGAIYFRDGEVACAESDQTPPAGPVPDGDLPPLARISAALAMTEPTVDAALDLLSAQARYGKFRPSRVPDAGLTPDMPLEVLLAEVARRQRVLRQLSAVLTPDTALARNPRISPESIRVSALQWALLIRVGSGSTPRDLAWALGRSVFGTTAEAYRLLARRLLLVAGDPPGEGPGLPVMSFVRAASVEEGDTMPAINSGNEPGGVSR